MLINPIIEISDNTKSGNVTDKNGGIFPLFPKDEKKKLYNIILLRLKNRCYMVY
jgi:hypothetical protein